ncbi:MAG: amino acid adenylation domain-containing protein, partial [Acidobacteria bacterium]|nr:amino acid adenylation domain-containing protein [Acidobacteriota bacterium]
EQVERTPDAVAVVYEEQQLSYAELNRRANQLGHYLRGLGVGPDERVGICVERGLEMVVGLLAILKAGGAYVPLDPDYPVERLSFMLEDAQVPVLLTQGHVRQRLPMTWAQVFCLDSDWGQVVQHSSKNLQMSVDPKSLAYVIYTSGSTGVPKGVMVEHGGVCNLAMAQIRSFAVEPDSRVLQFASFSFDACVSEMVMALCRGASLQLCAQAEVVVGDALEKAVARRQISHATLPPVVLATLPEGTDLESVCTLIVAGESLSEGLAKRWVGGRHLINAYGPTEATVCATMHGCRIEEMGKKPPIGRAIANSRTYILDRNGEPVPVGVTGELYIGGAGVARGYYQRADLTAEKFVPDPFAGGRGERMYRTGDLGRWRGDGTIEFVGRNDEQVKIRGYRIELGEIEATLASHPWVREAVVVVREDEPGEKRLVAYYTGVQRGELGGVGAEEEVGAEQLRAYVSAKLPEYMVPAAYVGVEQMPLSANGKLDRKALPKPDGEAYGVREYEAPRGETESILAGIWAELLQVERVGRQDNFFELGGHSLLVVALIERMRQRGLQADVRTLFTAPTLAGLAATMSGDSGMVEVPANRISPECEAITPDMLPLVELSQEEIETVITGVTGGAGNVQDIYPLAPLQEGILFHHLMGGEGDPYLLAVLCSFDSRLRLERYLQAMQAVIDRHDILRTAVMWEGLSEPVQVVGRKAVLPIEELDLDPAQGDIGEQLYARFDPRHHRIDVRQAPLLRIHIAYDKENDRWLMVELLHHLVGDHSTLEVMQEEIQAHLLGQADRLPAPQPFRNLVAQARMGMSKAEHEAFFRGMLGDVEEATAPFGLLDVQGDGTGLEEARLMLDSALARRIRERARRLGVSAASLCHVAWGQVLARVSGREDVVFGTVLFGRMQGGAGTDRVMGLFINTLPIRIHIGGEGVEASVRRTHVLLADLLRHEHASLALAQRCSGVAAPMPLFSALLNYRHSRGAAQAASAEAQRAWEGMRWLRGEERSNYPFTLSVEDLGEEFGLTAQTVASIDPKRVCEYMRRALESLIEALETEPGKAVCALEVLPEWERQQVVYEWNETAAEFPRDKCIHELFEEQVERTPDAVAVVYEEQQLSYAELNRRANQLGHYLRGLGVGPDERVGI